MQEMKKRHYRVVQQIIHVATTIRTAVSLEQSVGITTAIHQQQHGHLQQQTQLRDV